MISRRFFIGGVISLGTFTGCRFLAVRDFLATKGKPNLKFGVISDIHIWACAGDANCEADSSIFRHTLEWFRDQGVDAVMIVGDMADHGLTDQLQTVADTWNAVFPDGRAQDGHSVEKLFVYGNHDWEGHAYGSFAKRRFPDEDERNRHILRRNYARNWERIFNEAYSPIYRKDIKGYTFVGQHWDHQGWESDCRFERIKPFLFEQSRSIDTNRPFFYFQHPHPKDTCYGSWAWGHDIGIATETLSAFPNAIAFSGHSHFSLTDERSIWQGAFTSLGTGSLRYTGMPFSSRMPIAYENTGTEGDNAAELDAMKLMGRISSDSQQGMLVSVYDDCVVFRRREFGCDLDLGADWVLPLPAAESKPFAFVEHARKMRAPQFPSDAVLTLSRKKAKTRKTEGHEQTEKDAVLLEFPAALAVAGVRPFEYEVAAVSVTGEKSVFYVMAEGFNHGVGHKRMTGKSSCLLSTDRLPHGTIRFEVTPLDCWWKRGRPISCEYSAQEVSSLLSANTDCRFKA